MDENDNSIAGSPGQKTPRGHNIDRDLFGKTNGRNGSGSLALPFNNIYPQLQEEVATDGRVRPAYPQMIPAYALKRAFDCLIAGLGLIGSAPLWLLIGLTVKFEDGGPIFYFQERVGRGNRRFRIMKFRSMTVDAERQTGPVWACENDGRITRVGRILRATAMDELPQLWNILKGDISFVGPRAERPEFVEKFAKQIPNYNRRHVVRPGLTGLAQLYGRYDSHPRQKLRYDVIYVQNQSFWLDLKLIAMSFWVTFRGKWESRDKKF